MFLRVGLQAEHNILDRMLYHFSGLKGIKSHKVKFRIKLICKTLFLFG